MPVQIIRGDARSVLSTMADESIDCCISSPPYFNLRHYHHEHQIGQEDTPAEYIAELVKVFAEVKRVLKRDGTCWLNLGDSYMPENRGEKAKPRKESRSYMQNAHMHSDLPTRKSQIEAMKAAGIKRKETIGIPWRVAEALRGPFYKGRMTQERDRVWMAAMLDGEGTICAFEYERKNGGGLRTGTLVFITNGGEKILAECDRIWPGATYRTTLKPGDQVLGATATRPCWRWQIQDVDERAAFIAEIYPYLIEKKAQGLVGYNLTAISAKSKRLGRGGEDEETKEKRRVLASLLSDLNQHRPHNFPNWLVEPPSMWERGFYVRQEIIWHKPNAMPESVKDRCTRANESIFLLTKSEDYFFDADAIAEDAKYWGAAAGSFERSGPGARPPGASSAPVP